MLLEKALPPGFVVTGDFGRVLWTGQARKFQPDRIFLLVAEQVGRGPIERFDQSVIADCHDPVRDIVEDRAAACLAFDELARLQKQLNEDRHLCSQDLRHHWCEHEVDRAARVRNRDLHFIPRSRCDEDDGCVLGVSAHANESGRLIAVHHRHVYVQQDDRERSVHDLPQCRVP